MLREVLRSRGIGIRLPFLRPLEMPLLMGRLARLFFEVLVFARGPSLFGRCLLVIGSSARGELLVAPLVATLAGAGQRFARKHFDA